MIHQFKQRTQDLLRHYGYQFARIEVPSDPTVPEGAMPVDFDAAAIQIINEAAALTMTSVERRYALHQAVRYLVKHDIAGAFAECGVWKGGSVLVMARTLQQLGSDDRQIYLYDTFAGMTAPTEEDVDFAGVSQVQVWQDHHYNTSFNAVARADLQSVQQSVFATGYPKDKFNFVKGPVEETIPGTAPDAIALLRLDTDFYESTRHELEHLFPRLVLGGVLIIDDYGHFQGAKKAVDEYFEQHGVQMLLNRVDYSGRIGVKI